MAYVPKEGSGSLFKNDRKTSETHPDYTGTIMVNGKDANQVLIDEKLAIPYMGGNKDESRAQYGVVDLWNTDYENPQEHDDDHEHGDEPEGIDWHAE